ncbi:MAG: 3'(2'),5'-bisphosphate nucleotidase CysQ [Hyphomicrobiaceae bacterium]|nr:3'(2'),5'-bisphosphate nucleotidase CysQ [Hyphomicrobiaceae bacterium]
MSSSGGIAQIADDLVWRLVGPVLEAGAIEMRHYRDGVEVQSKADQSPVTLADQEAEEVLLAALAREAPGIPVVAEEAVAEGRVPAIGTMFFLVDPLDGTREFINKRDEFTVNVALVVEGRPELGLVYAPALGELYVTLGAAVAAVARLAPDAQPKSLADCGFRQIRVRVPDPARLTAVASRSHMTAETEAFLARYAIADRRDSGSSLKFCTMARGEADIYPRLAPTMEWDTAAGHAVLRAAGGCVTAPDGAPFVYGKSDAGFRNGHFVAWGAREPLPAGT